MRGQKSKMDAVVSLVKDNEKLMEELILEINI